MRGKCALITGSIGGLGAAAAARLAAEGCHVVLSGFADRDQIEAQRRELEQAHGVRVLYHGADLTKPGEIADLMATAIDAFGGVDILVNNAVVRHFAQVHEFAPEDWERAIAVNVTAAFHTIRLALPGMRERGWGRIVNMSSVYGLRATVGRVDYVTTKTALIGLTRAVALENLDTGVTCNAICPGTALTPNTDARIRALMAAEALSWEAAVKKFLSGKNPSGRFIDTQNVAALIVFLCSEAGNDITGAALPVDGAWTAS